MLSNPLQQNALAAPSGQASWALAIPALTDGWVDLGNESKLSSPRQGIARNAAASSLNNVSPTSSVPADEKKHSTTPYMDALNAARLHSAPLILGLNGGNENNTREVKLAKSFLEIVKTTQYELKFKNNILKKLSKEYERLSSKSYDEELYNHMLGVSIEILMGDLSDKAKNRTFLSIDYTNPRAAGPYPTNLANKIKPSKTLNIECKNVCQTFIKKLMESLSQSIKEDVNDLDFINCFGKALEKIDPASYMNIKFKEFANKFKQMKLSQIEKQMEKIDAEMKVLKAKIELNRANMSHSL